MKVIEGGIVSARGFRATGTAAGIKYQGRKDMAMIVSDSPCVLAGVFTSNVVKAAPVLWDMKVLRQSDYAQAVVVNAGIANACTGKQGEESCRETASEAASLLGIPEDSVLIGSTGVIGMPLDMEKIKNGIRAMVPELGNAAENGKIAAESIMTTDTIPKQVAVQVEIKGKTVTIGGMAKGSGMIHPNMGTMLAYVTTDAAIKKELLQSMLERDVKDTFNMVSVDGDTSTNDTLLVLANGMAGNEIMDGEDEESRKFFDALHYVNENLAKMIAGDGEGATKLLEIRVTGAANTEDAKKLAKSVTGSSLTKAAMYGNDANFGRILCALGYSGVQFNPDQIDFYFEAEGKRMMICRNGQAADYNEEEASALLAHEKVVIDIYLKEGRGSAVAWGCDLTYDYVKINADYRS